MDRMKADLVLRHEVRAAEDRVNKARIDIDLPSEDAIMDEPGRYTARMRGLLGRLERLEQALVDFNKR